MNFYMSVEQCGTQQEHHSMSTVVAKLFLKLQLVVLNNFFLDLGWMFNYLKKGMFEKKNALERLLTGFI